MRWPPSLRNGRMPSPSTPPLCRPPSTPATHCKTATGWKSSHLSPPSVRSSLELLSAAYAVHPGFAEARILEITAQCRPTLPDNLPAIRQTAPRTLEINGLYRHGYMIAPAMLDVTLEVLATGQSTMASRFDLSLQLLGER